MGYWDDPDFISDPDPVESVGLVLAEEAALKDYLSGLTVPTPKGPAPVKVWFRWPDSERQIIYPYITIDFIDIHPDYTRWESVHSMDPQLRYFEEDDGSGGIVSGYRSHLYRPSESPSLGEFPDDVSSFQVDQYMAFQAVYQVSVFSRSALHDRFLTARFMTDIFGPRPFWIAVGADETWRRCELNQFVVGDTAETTESSKRIFRKNYTISIDCEIPQSKIREVYKVLRVHGDLYADSQTSREAPNHPADGPHEVAVGSFTVDPEEQP